MAKPIGALLACVTLAALIGTSESFAQEWRILGTDDEGVVRATNFAISEHNAGSDAAVELVAVLSGKTHRRGQYQYYSVCLEVTTEDSDGGEATRTAEIDVLFVIAERWELRGWEFKDCE